MTCGSSGVATILFLEVAGGSSGVTATVATVVASFGVLVAAKLLIGGVGGGGLGEKTPETMTASIITTRRVKS